MLCGLRGDHPWPFEFSFMLDPALARCHTQCIGHENLKHNAAKFPLFWRHADDDTPPRYDGFDWW